MSILEECCLFLVKHAESVNTRGSKYLSGKKDESSDEKLSELYAMKLLTDFLPHILSCFEHIFHCQKSTAKKGKDVALKLLDPTSPSSLSALKEMLSPDLNEIYQFCLSILVDAKLVKVSLPVSPNVSAEMQKLQQRA